MKKFTYRTPAGDTGTVTALNTMQARLLVAARNGMEENEVLKIDLTRIAVKPSWNAAAHVTRRARG